MQKNLKVAAGSAAALAILVAGGLAIALPVQAASASKPVSVVEPVDATDTDDVQDEVEDDTNDGELADDNGTEDTSADIGGAEVKDGTQD